jgi:hypothetical protein
MFDFFKKKKEEPAYDVTNLSLRDLDFGFVFDYDMKSWVVKEVYEYDWGDNNFTREYKVDSGEGIAFLSITDDGELNIVLSTAMKIRKIEENIVDEITRTEKAPDTIHYEGETYYLESDSAGYFRDLTKKTEDWEELISWDYYDENEEKIISITQWDERTFDAYSGIVLEPYQFSNIIPGS